MSLRDTILVATTNSGKLHEVAQLLGGQPVRLVTPAELDLQLTVEETGATYAENAHRREVAARRRAQDARDAVRHRHLDLQAQDKTPKSDRPQFAVVGEGSRTAQDNYRLNYQRIFGVPPRRPNLPLKAHGSPAKNGNSSTS